MSCNLTGDVREGTRSVCFGVLVSPDQGRRVRNRHRDLNEDAEKVRLPRAPDGGGGVAGCQRELELSRR